MVHQAYCVVQYDARTQRLAKKTEPMVSAAYLGVMAGADQNVHLDGYPALGLPRPLLKLGQLTAQNLEGLIDMQPMQIEKNDTCSAACLVSRGQEPPQEGSCSMYTRGLQGSAICRT